MNIYMSVKSNFTTAIAINRSLIERGAAPTLRSGQGFQISKRDISCTLIHTGSFFHPPWYLYDME